MGSAASAAVPGRMAAKTRRLLSPVPTSTSSLPNDTAVGRRNGALASALRDPLDRVPQPFDSLIVKISIEGLRRAPGHVFDVSPHVLLGGRDVREQHAFLPIPNDSDPCSASAVLDVHASEGVVVEVFDSKRKPKTFQGWTKFCECTLMERGHREPVWLTILGFSGGREREPRRATGAPI